MKNYKKTQALLMICLIYLLSSCNPNRTIDGSTINMALKSCKNNEGVSKITFCGGIWVVTCMDGERKKLIVGK